MIDILHFVEASCNAKSCLPCFVLFFAAQLESTFWLKLNGVESNRSSSDLSSNFPLFMMSCRRLTLESLQNLKTAYSSLGKQSWFVIDMNGDILLVSLTFQASQIVRVVLQKSFAIGSADR